MTTYYVDVTSGDNGDTGQSEVLAWATLGYAANQVAADDLVYVKASASYTADDPDVATTNWNITTVGTVTTPIVWEGYTDTPGDDGVVTVDAQDTNTSCLLVSTAATYNVFKNFKFTQADGAGAAVGGGDNITFKNCSFDNNAGNGVTSDNSISFEKCVSHNNTGDGFLTDKYAIFIACVAHTNTGDGFDMEGGTAAFCLAYNNGAANVGYLSASVINSCFINCSGDGENGGTSVGINLSSAGARQSAIVNCILYDYNVGMTANNDCGEQVIVRNNLLYENNTNYTNLIAGEGDVIGSSDPFTASGSDDYSLKSGSEAIDAGIDGSDAVADWGL